MQKVVLCGAGFVGSNIARTLIRSNAKLVQIASRNPERVTSKLKKELDSSERILPPAAVDITKPDTLREAFKGASVIVSLVGILHGSTQQFEAIQWKGAENVAKEAKAAGAKLIHFSAIGADPNSSIPYARTKALGEEAVFNACPDATVIRPSLVFGPEDSFFNRFAQLSTYLPFLPVFGGGTSRFQPVSVNDLAKLVSIICSGNDDVKKQVAGKVIEAGGPEVFTYRQIMELVLKHSNRWRPIVSVPFAVGQIQGAVLEQLPENLFTVTRSQVEQLKNDNIVDPNPKVNYVSFEGILRKHGGGTELESVHDSLPTYLRRA